MVAVQRASTKAAQAPIEAKTEIEVKDESIFPVPNFTVKQLLGAIPAECFERSALHSSLYIIQDVILISIFVYGTTFFPAIIEAANLSKFGSKALSFGLWNFYWFWTGLFATGLWVIAHECGHQAFSTSKTVNNAVGWVIHSALGVPYHAWRISHGRHHAATGHLTRDEVFVPRTREQMSYPAFDETKEDVHGLNVTEERQSELVEAINDAPIVVLLSLFAQQLFGWPLYLIRNASGQKSYPKWTNHFQPSSPIFDKRHRNQIIASNVGLGLLFAGLGAWAHYRGFGEVVKYYVVPYLYVNHWLVGIVFIQHTDPLVPHYSNSVWTFPRGALATIDRPCLGWVGTLLLHKITTTHVSHHISSKIPHYNADKATEALKEFLGVHYQSRDGSCLPLCARFLVPDSCRFFPPSHTLISSHPFCLTGNFLVALFTAFRSCRFVDEIPGNDVFFYKDARGVGQMKAKFEGGNVSDSGVDLAGDEKLKTQ
ncbi:delta-12 fatty acid desaturase [Mrakia frigida]|uniref:delta-12 fatty acid desaturase n=1 Tax=Mrakia frigida TaxID=29902 RepID=UPI003FCBEF15